jgi:hypothetical protein
MLTLNTCNKSTEEDIPVIIDPEEPLVIDADYYVYVDRTTVEDPEALGKWDAVILGKDGADFFYQFNETLPVKFAIWDRENETLGALFQFDEEGLPDAMQIGADVYLFSNFRQNLCMITVVHNGDVIFEQDSLESDLDWDEYKTGNVSPELRMGDAERYVKGMNVVISSGGCLVSLVQTGLAVPSGILTAIPAVKAVFSCGSALINIVDFMCDDCVPSWLEDAATVGGIVSGNTDTAAGIIAVANGGVSLAAGEAAKMIDDLKQQKVIASIQVSAREDKVETVTADLILTVDYFNSYNWQYVKNELFIAGLCIGTEPGPTLENNMKVVEMDYEHFEVLQSSRFAVQRFTFFGLKSGITYYYRPFVAHYGVYSYGEEKSFTTEEITIQLVYPKPEELKVNEFTDVKFKCVSSERLIPQKEMAFRFASMGGSVNFSGKPTDESGEVEVRWQPREENATLTATAYDGENNKVAEYVLAVKSKEETSLIKLLMDGSWSCIYTFLHFNDNGIWLDSYDNFLVGQMVFKFLEDGKILINNERWILVDDLKVSYSWSEANDNKVSVWIDDGYFYNRFNWTFVSYENNKLTITHDYPDDENLPSHDGSWGGITFVHHPHEGN